MSADGTVGRVHRTPNITIIPQSVSTPILNARGAPNQILNARGVPTPILSARDVATYRHIAAKSDGPSFFGVHRGIKEPERKHRFSKTCKKFQRCKNTERDIAQT